MITIHSLVKEYGKAFSLKINSLALTPGSITGVIGRNGCGKSTFFNCMARITAFEGTIRYNNDLLTKEEVAFLPTDNYFFPRCTGREYLSFIKAAQKKVRPGRELFDLPLDKYADSYSHGMMKKLALAGILLLERPLVLLDEPFNGIDFESYFTIKQQIRALKNEGKIVVLSSHILPSLTDICDTILWIAEGRLIKRYEKNDFHCIESDFTSAGNSIPSLVES